MVDDLREHVREGTGWIEDFDDAVRRALAVPHAVAEPDLDRWRALAMPDVITLEV